MSIGAAEIRQILEALERSGWDEAVITVGDVTISVGRDGAATGQALKDRSAEPALPAAAPAAGTRPAIPPPASSASPAPPVPSVPADGGTVVTAPTVGIFWRSPQPGASPFVEIGSTVARGDTLCILEVMKLMNNLVADVAGTVTAIHVENATQVEVGTPLVTIAPH